MLFQRIRLPLFACTMLMAILVPLAHAAPVTSIDSKEMAATLRDMIAWPRAVATFSTRLFVTPEEMDAAFAPQSAWGRQHLTEWTDGWQAAFDRVVVEMTRRGELAQALSPAGLRLPILMSFLNNVPEYATIDRLLHYVDLDMCDQNADAADCYLVLYLRQASNGRPVLRNIRVVRPDGIQVEIPGKVQQ